ncbi:integrase DNA-binding domain-containing protein [Ruthenibacterium lactatiformans]|uniref:integrase DNA-binding domain-containing protein n=1 Tax=Ruthenibacterium lactatiformans TaxID=1550024 RepID=UPI0039F5D8DD
MAKVRKDKRGRNLHKGEYQRPDGRYAYAYRYNGKRVFMIFSTFQVKAFGVG